MNRNPYGRANGHGRQALIGVAGRLASTARRKRFQRYIETMRPRRDERILDVGCGGGAWSLAQLDPTALVTGVDLVASSGFEQPHQSFVVADACDLPFDDDAFDVAFSNSVLEHIELERRPAFAHEMRRVAKRYWVQTPNYWFPIEPHALLPAVQFLPTGARRLAWRASPRGVDHEEALALLTGEQLAELFDDALILRERWGPLNKSLLAVGPRALFKRREGG